MAVIYDMSRVDAMAGHEFEHFIADLLRKDAFMFAEGWTKKQAALKSEQVTLQEELANLKGLFTGRRRREIEARLEEIKADLTKYYIK